MASIEQVTQFLARVAPLPLAESWDNVGLLVGDRKLTATRVMTCLTITPRVVSEAIERNANLIVAHHPLPFQPLKRITTDNTTGRMLWELVGNQVGIYSAHTAFDSAATGINQQIASGLGLESIEPLNPIESSGSAASDPRLQGLGSGRLGRCAVPTKLNELLFAAARITGSKQPRCVGAPDQEVKKVAIACGSGGSFLDAARRRGCQALITGEANFHSCLEAEATGVGLILLGHYASERFAMEWLAAQIAGEFPDVEAWASASEDDPIWSGA